MKRKIIFNLFITIVLVFFIGIITAWGEVKIPYPKGYRNWHHIKSMLIYDSKHPLFNPFGGIHHIYVNKKGLEGYKKGGLFPDGAIIVFDLLETK